MRNSQTDLSLIDKLTAVKGFAHRGLHNIQEGIVENSPSAIQAAIDGGVGIELDVQMSAGRVPMVFHDETLSRLCARDGRLAFMKADELRRVPYSVGADCIIGLEECLEMVDGKVPLLIEVKSHWHGKPQMEQEIATVLKDYKGAYGLMSFDPIVIENLKLTGIAAPLALVTARFAPKDWVGLDEAERQAGTMHFEKARALKVDFLAHHVADLKNPLLEKIKLELGLPLFSWTVSTPEMLDFARAAGAVPIFEGGVVPKILPHAC